MANADDSSVSIYASARSTAAMRTRDHMLTHVESSRTMATGLSSGRILVVDNDPAVLQLISDYFGEHGIKNVSAKGRSAVARQLAGGDPSAIILDLRLGQDNGLDLLREIRKSSDVPIIILTGSFARWRRLRGRTRTRCRRLPHQAVRCPQIVCSVPRRAAAL